MSVARNFGEKLHRTPSSAAGYQAAPTRESRSLAAQTRARNFIGSLPGAHALWSEEGKRSPSRRRHPTLQH